MEYQEKQITPACVNAQPRGTRGRGVDSRLRVLPNEGEGEVLLVLVW